MAYKAEGKLYKIFDTEQKTASFQAREFVVEIQDGKFPQLVKFQLTQDKCDLIDAFQEGADIAVDFDLRGREWNDRFFTNLNAWRISSADGAETEVGTDERTSEDGGFDDDIPF